MGRIVAAYAYREGRRVGPIDLSLGAVRSLEPGGFEWVGLFAPEERLLRALQTRYGLHELAVQDALHAHQLPKLERYGDSIFVVLRTAGLGGGQLLLGETHLFVGPGYLVSVRHGASESYAPVRARLEAAPHLLAHGVDRILHAILDFVVDHYAPVVDALGAEVEALEQEIFSHALTRAGIDRIHRLRGELLRLRRATAPVADLCARLLNLDLPWLGADLHPYFRDVADHARRLTETIDALRETVGFAFEAALLLESRQHSDIQRRFAAWAAILAVPTAIAGIYGMNFEHMPELALEWGYPAILLLIGTICTTLYRRFRRAGWL